MKMTKTLSLDEEIVRKLMKEQHQSHLVNTLLIDHYKKKEFDGLNEKELNKELSIIKLTEATKLKIEAIRNGK